MEKYPWLSPYTYCGGNPIMYTDHDGLKFTERAQKVVNAFKVVIEEIKSDQEFQIEMRNNLKNVFGETMAKVNQQEIMAAEEIISVMDDSKSELEELQNSSQLYDIKLTSSNETKGTTTFPDESDAVLMTFPPKMVLAAHELKHAYQFEVGEISFGEAANGFYDLTDEEAAYKRATYFGGKMSDFNPDNYGRYPKDNRSLSKQYSGMKNMMPSILQAVADKNGIKFRWEGRTYISNKLLKK